MHPALRRGNLCLGQEADSSVCPHVLLVEPRADLGCPSLNWRIHPPSPLGVSPLLPALLPRPLSTHPMVVQMVMVLGCHVIVAEHGPV